MKQKTWVEISESALQSNSLEFKKILGEDVFFLAIIKGNGYGAGIKTVVTATKSIVDWYGVDSLDEAELARKSCKNPILILGYVSPESAAEVVDKGFSLVLYDYSVALALSKKATKRNPARVHIKVDSGLVRLGLLPEDAIVFAKKISKLPNIVIEGLYTHYAKLIDENHNKIYLEQLEKFSYVVDKLSSIGIRPKFLHTASSVASVLYKETRFNMVRIGIPIYGLWSRKSTLELIHENFIGHNLFPVISWKTTIVNIKKIPANTGVGYGYSEIVPKETVVAVLGAGYYDGIDKRYGKIGSVLINGKRAKILGGISMNMCMVDVSGIKNIKIGDVAVLIGKSGREEITAYDFAELINTSTYEVISRINPLIDRILVS